MLAAQHRLARNEGFGTVLKKGKRAGNRYMVVNLLMVDDPLLGAKSSPAKGGIVVGKKQIPASVSRNRVKRQMRHLLVQRLKVLPFEARVVVRMLGPSANASSEVLGANLDRLLNSNLQRLQKERLQTDSVLKNSVMVGEVP